MNNLVIGASSGIGKRVVERLGGIGVARREEKLKQFDKFEVFDISKLNEIGDFLSYVAKKYGKIDNLIFCAGIQNIKPLKVMDIEEIIEIFNVNLFSAMVFMKYLKKRVFNQHGSVIFISSIAGIEAEKGILAYSASKGALNNFIKGASKEFAPIRVNGVAPGFLKTEMTEKFSDIYNDEFIKNLEEKSSLGLVEIDDVVDVIEFLLKAKKITGEIIRVDGGLE